MSASNATISTRWKVKTAKILRQNGTRTTRKIIRNFNLRKHNKRDNIARHRDETWTRKLWKTSAKPGALITRDSRLLITQLEVFTFRSVLRINNHRSDGWRHGEFSYRTFLWKMARSKSAFRQSHNAQSKRWKRNRTTFADPFVCGK